MHIGSDRPTLKHLYKHVVKHAAYKWRDLGVQLLEDNQIIMLDMIATNHPLDIAICCKVFMKWLETRVDASWNQLIRALRSPTVQLISLADQLEQMMSTECKIYTIATHYYKLYNYYGCRLESYLDCN